MTNTINHVFSISGGKDSTAMMLLAKEKQVSGERVFADTGHEHDLTYEYLEYLRVMVGPIRVVKADVSDRLAKRRQTIAAKWPKDLTEGSPGRWTLLGHVEQAIHDNDKTRDMTQLVAYLDEVPKPPPVPSDPYQAQQTDYYQWQPARKPITQQAADEIVERALDIMRPTGNAFLDLCLLKGRFPSSQARFCTQELKYLPIYHQVIKPIMAKGQVVHSWQAVRADESTKRARLVELEEKHPQLYSYRPLLAWTVEQVFALHKKHGIKPNPLYKNRLSRVGCMPCIHARKAEIFEIAKRFPDVIDQVRNYEKLVSYASKRGAASFFVADKVPGVGDHRARIDNVVAWAGGQVIQGQASLLAGIENQSSGCASLYGLCE